MSDSADSSKKNKTVKRVCKCENCGNEAEMVVTCSLESESKKPLKAGAAAQDEKTPHTRVKGTGTCTHCGNEADMWIDI